MKFTVLIVTILTASAMAFMNSTFDDAYQGLTSNSVIEIAYDSNGVWLGTAGGASYTTDNGATWQTFRAGSGLPTDLVSALAANYYNDTRYVCAATIHTEEYAGTDNEYGDGISITTDDGANWVTETPPSTNWVGMLSWDLDIYKDDIYSACWYGGLLRSTDGGQLWENLYLNASDSIDLWIDSTFYNYTNYYFSVKVDTTLAPDTISVFAGTAYGINRFVFTRYDVPNTKQDTAWQIAHNPVDTENSIPGNHVVALDVHGRPGRIFDVFIDGSCAYVAHGSEGLMIVSISNLSNPSFMGSVNTPGRAHGVAVDSSYAYVADYNEGLQIIDISNPNNPNLIGSYDTDGHALNVSVAGNYAYVADDNSGLAVIDITDPANPTLDTIYTPGSVKDAFIDSNYAYVAAGSDGLVIYDLAAPPESALLGTYDSLTNVYSVFVDSNIAFVADLDSGLQAIDVSDPANPAFIAGYNVDGKARDVYYDSGSDSGYIYVVDEFALRVFQLPADGGDTLSLELVGQYYTPGSAVNMAISGTNAFIADLYNGLQIVDIGDPTLMTFTGNFAPVCSTYIWAACRVGVTIGSSDTHQKYAVAYSVDYGKTWTTVIDEAAWDFAFLGDTVFAATNNGLYYSDDLENWDVLSEAEDSTGTRVYYPSGFYAVETIGSAIWAGGADGTIRIAGSDTSVFRSQLYEDDHYAYPSPFSPIESTRKGATIHYKLEASANVTIKIYDFNLDLVRTVVDNESRPGDVEIDTDVWFGKNDNGELVANGIYFYNIKRDSGEDWWGKVVVIK
ncbi:MAG: hypothetical protein J7K40_10435 [candidate division Zixibacteria bacterium]|nr:hypothetical protein [candidate division Zixibacteria bacterium]